MDGNDQIGTQNNESISRREFFKVGGTAVAAALLAACKQEPENSSQNPQLSNESIPPTETPSLTFEQQMENFQKQEEIMRQEYEKSGLRMLERRVNIGKNIGETGVRVGNTEYPDGIKEGTELSNAPPLILKYDPDVTLLHLRRQGLLGIGCISPDLFPMPREVKEVHIKDLALASSQGGNDPYKKYELRNDAAYLLIPILHGGPPSSIVPIYENGRVRVEHQKIKVSPNELQRNNDTAYYSFALLEVFNTGNSTYTATVKGVLDNNKSKLYISLFDVPIDIDNTLRKQKEK